MAVQNPSSSGTLQEEDGTEGQGKGQGRGDAEEEAAAEVSPQPPSGEHEMGDGWLCDAS